MIRRLLRKDRDLLISMLEELKSQGSQGIGRLIEIGYIEFALKWKALNENK